MLWSQAHTQQQSQLAQQQRLRALDRPTSGSAAARIAGKAGGDAAALATQTDKARDQLRQPWFAMLDGMAVSARDANVGILTIEAQAQNRGVVVTAEARDFVAALAWVEQLRASRLFGSVALTSHELRSDAGGARARFTLELVWSPTA